MCPSQLQSVRPGPSAGLLVACLSSCSANAPRPAIEYYCPWTEGPRGACPAPRGRQRPTSTWRPRCWGCPFRQRCIRGECCGDHRALGYIAVAHPKSYRLLRDRDGLAGGETRWAEGNNDPVRVKLKGARYCNAGGYGQRAFGIEP